MIRHLIDILTYIETLRQSPCGLPKLAHSKMGAHAVLSRPVQVRIVCLRH